MKTDQAEKNLISGFPFFVERWQCDIDGLKLNSEFVELELGPRLGLGVKHLGLKVGLANNRNYLSLNLGEAHKLLGEFDEEQNIKLLINVS